MPSLRTSKRVAGRRNIRSDRPRVAKLPKYYLGLVLLVTAAFISMALLIFAWRKYELPFNFVLAGLCFLYALFALCFVILLADFRNKANRLISVSDIYVEYDYLTGIPSFYGFQHAVEEVLKRSDGKKRLILVFDIKDFKYINDAYGYPVGDETILHISKVLESILDKDDPFGRMGGDCFVLMREYLGDDEFGLFFNKLVSSIKKAPVCVRHNCRLYLSGGVYILDHDAGKLSVEAMVDRAMLARKIVKHQGVTGYAVYTEKMRQKVHYEKEIEKELAEALEKGKLEICYQPVYDIQKGDIIAGAEALVRCNSSKMGLLLPSSFIPLLERNGFIVEMDRYVFRQVCAYIRKSLDRKRRIVPISVNISRTDMCQPDFVEVYSGIKQEYGIPDGKIQLEFTENIAYEDYERFSSIVGELRKNGFVCALDDFGKGNSSLNVLKDLPVDILKLDILFFREGGYRSRAETVVSSIVSMAKALEMRIVAEGVETRDQVEFLRRIGCDAVQGYVFAKPMHARELDDYIDELPKREIIMDNAYRSVRRTDNSLWPDSDSRAQYEAALEFTDSIVTEIDLDRGLFHTSGIRQNGVIYEKSGSYDEYVGRLASERVHPEDREEWLGKFSSKSLRAAFFRGDSRVSMRYRALDMNNSRYIWFEKTVVRLDKENGNSCRALSFVKDIDMKKWTEISGGENQIHLAGTLLDLYRSIYEINLETLSCRKLNTDRTNGPKPGNYRDFLETTAAAIVDDERAAFLDTFSPGNLRRELERENALIQAELRMKLDNQVRWYSVTVTRISDMPDQIMAMMLIQDIHDRKARELERFNKVNRLKNAIISTFEDIMEVNLSADAIERIGENVRPGEQFPRTYTAYVDEMIRNSIHPDDRDRFLRTFGREALTEAMQKDGVSERIDRYRLIDTKGNYHWMRFYALKDPGNDPLSFIIYLCRKNIDSSMRELEILQEKADRDSLTGALNRRIFEQNVRADMARNKNGLHAFMIVDIDDFKKINDRWGHMAGDETLVSLSKLLAECFRSEDIIGRIGGDEFAVYMKDIPSIESAVKKADEICRMIRASLSGNILERAVTASIGIALYGIDGNTYEELFKKADIALYRAKEKGKNRTQLFSNISGW